MLVAWSACARLAWDDVPLSPKAVIFMLPTRRYERFEMQLYYLWHTDFPIWYKMTGFYSRIIIFLLQCFDFKGNWRKYITRYMPPSPFVILGPVYMSRASPPRKFLDQGLKVKLCLLVRLNL